MVSFYITMHINGEARRMPGETWQSAPEILQPLITRKVDTGAYRNGEHLIEVFPRVKTEGAKEWHAYMLKDRLKARGLHFKDPKDDNIAFLLDNTPIVCDAGEIVRTRYPSKFVEKAGLFTSRITGMRKLRPPLKYSWDFEKQTAGLTKNWKVLSVSIFRCWDCRKMANLKHLRRKRAKQPVDIIVPMGHNRGHRDTCRQL